MRMLPAAGLLLLFNVLICHAAAAQPPTAAFPVSLVTGQVLLPFLDATAAQERAALAERGIRRILIRREPGSLDTGAPDRRKTADSVYVQHFSEHGDLLESTAGGAPDPYCRARYDRRGRLRLFTSVTRSHRFDAAVRPMIKVERWHWMRSGDTWSKVSYRRHPRDSSGGPLPRPAFAHWNREAAGRRMIQYLREHRLDRAGEPPETITAYVVRYDSLGRMAGYYSTNARYIRKAGTMVPALAAAAAPGPQGLVAALLRRPGFDALMRSGGMAPDEEDEPVWGVSLQDSALYAAFVRRGPDSERFFAGCGAFGYDDSGRLSVRVAIGRFGAAERVDSFGYDAQGKLSEWVCWSGSGSGTFYSWELDGGRNAIDPRRLRWRFSYDAEGRVCGVSREVFTQWNAASEEFERWEPVRLQSASVVRLSYGRSGCVSGFSIERRVMEAGGERLTQFAYTLSYER